MNNKYTICIDCRFHRFHEGLGHFCIAQELPKVFDYVTGEEYHAEVNDLGGVYRAITKYPMCLKINTDGNCHLYSEIND